MRGGGDPSPGRTARRTYDDRKGKSGQEVCSTTPITIPSSSANGTPPKRFCGNTTVCAPTQRAERERLIRSLLGAVGDGFVIEQPFQCDYGYNIEIGRNFYSNHNLVILDAAKVIIGDHVFIAPNVGIYTAGHPLDTDQRAEGLEYARPVTIGDDVWIGGGVSILPGVHIGNGTTIGAGSVVTRSLPARVVAVGNPCRVIRQL